MHREYLNVYSRIAGVLTRIRIVSKHVDTAWCVGVTPVNVGLLDPVPFSEIAHEDALGVRKHCSGWFPKLGDIQREWVAGERCIQCF